MDRVTTIDGTHHNARRLYIKTVSAAAGDRSPRRPRTSSITRAGRFSVIAAWHCAAPHPVTAEGRTMKVLVATSDTQESAKTTSASASTATGTSSGVPRRAGPDVGRLRPPFAGLNSHRATTTAKVKEVSSPRTTLEALRSSLAQQGWPTEDVASWPPGWRSLSTGRPVVIGGARRHLHPDRGTQLALGGRRARPSRAS